jgi:hypothetical protein
MASAFLKVTYGLLSGILALTGAAALAQAPDAPARSAPLNAASALGAAEGRAYSPAVPLSTAAPRDTNVGAPAMLSPLRPPAPSAPKPDSAASMSGAAALAREPARSGAAFRAAAPAADIASRATPSGAMALAMAAGKSGVVFRPDAPAAYSLAAAAPRDAGASSLASAPRNSASTTAPVAPANRSK